MTVWVLETERTDRLCSSTAKSAWGVETSIRNNPPLRNVDVKELKESNVDPKALPACTPNRYVTMRPTAETTGSCYVAWR